MVLTLEVIGPKAKLGAGMRKVFRSVGGTIGRQANNDLVLPDPYVSARHARIHYADGNFYLEDHASANGICLNGAEHRLQAGDSYALKHGDLVLIEPFEIRVSIAREPDAAVVDPFQPADVSERASGDPLNLSELFGPNKGESKKQAKPEERPADPLREHYKPPAPVSPPVTPGGMIPTNWDNAVQPAAPRPSPPPSPRPAPEASASGPAQPAPVKGGSDTALMTLLEAAGIDVSGITATPELAEHFGQILRVVVEGVMALLQARQGIKDEFGLRSTTVKKADNNPLKFSADLDDALHNLLVKRNAAYLGPVEAFEDAFLDLRYHQLAMLHGVREAFTSMLANFDPDELQQEFDRQAKKGALLSVPVKLRYWELYREKVRDMVSDADDSFRQLFGDAFAQAYEKQLARLKSQGRAGKV